MPEKPSVPIELGGRMRNLRYDFNALVALEDELGIPIGELDKTIGGPVKLTTIRAFIWAGLLHEDPALKPADVGAWLDVSKLEETAEKMVEAVNAAFPKREPKAKKVTAVKES